MSEPKRTYIATVSMAPGETIALPADLDNADPSAIAAAIAAAERVKTEETRRLRATFGLDDAEKGGGHG